MPHVGGTANWLDPTLEIACGAGSYQWWPGEDRLVWSPGLIRLYCLRCTPTAEEGFSRLIHPEDRVCVEAETSAYLGSDAESFSHTFRIVRPDGSVRFILDRGAIERDDDGIARVVRGLNIDLTDDTHLNSRLVAGNRIEEKLRESAATLLHAQRCANAGIWDVDFVNSRVTWSEPFYELFGLPKSVEPSYENWIAAIHPDDRERVHNVTSQALAGVAAPRIEYRILCDGHVRWLHSEGRVICDSDNRPVRISGLTWDVTKRKEAEAALRASEERYRKLVEATGAVTWSSAPSGLQLAPQPGWTSFTGQTTEEMLGDGWSKALHPEDAASVMQRWFAAIAQGKPFVSEHRLCRHDGAWRWVSVHGAPIRDDEGHIVEYFGMSIDITERKELEAELRESEHKFKTLVENSPDIISRFDREKRHLYMSPSGERIAGMPASATVGKTHRELGMPAALCEQFESELNRAFPGEASASTFGYVDADGRKRHFHTLLSPEFAADGSVQTVLTISREVTELVETQQALWESKALLQAVLDGSLDPIFVKDREGRMVLANPATWVAIGKPAEFCLGKTDEQFLDNPADARTIMANDRRIMLSGEPETVEEAVSTPSGTRYYVNKKVPRRDAAGNVIGLISTARDISERKQAEEALRKSEERERQQRQELQTTLSVIPAGVFIAEDKTCTRITANRAGYKLLRLPEGRDVSKYAPEDEKPKNFEMYSAAGQPLAADQRPMKRAAATGENIEGFEYEIRFTDGDHKHLLANASPLFDAAGEVSGAIGALMDITERRHQEERIRLLLHEVNHRSKNMLAVVQSVARQTASASPEDFLERFSERVQAMATSQDLLVKAEWKGVELKDLVRGQLAHFQDLIASRIELRGPSLLVSTSAAQILGMAIHELSTNAGKYGALSVAEGRVSISWGLERDSAGGETFTMSWREQGGPPVSLPSRVGFGSAVIGPLAESSLTAEVDLDFLKTGLSWRLRCPAAGVVDGTRAAPTAELRSDISASRSSRPRVLVVEDEALIAMEIAQVLRNAHFEVLGPARAVAQALSLIEENGCDAAVLDINLSHETSEPVARKLMANGTRFVTLSGYARTQHPAIFDEVPALSKPLQPALLVAEIKKCLSSKAHRQGHPAG